MTEEVLDKENWKVEAQVVINDLKDHVKAMDISTKIPCDNSFIYLNLTTNEDKKYCIELSAQGFRIVGNEFDTNNLNNTEYFETPYSLLNSISPNFKVSFANALIQKLESIT